MKYDLHGRKVLVAGMAKSGLAAAELLLRHGAEVVAADERTLQTLGPVGERLNAMQVPLRPQSEESFTAVDLIVLSPGIPVDIAPLTSARAKGIPIIGEVELASYFLRGPIIGVTGSNGKTTTTSLIGHILAEAGIARQVGGNIGTPPTAMIDGSGDDKWNVLELSSFQLETIDEFRARIAVCLNVTPDHLDRHHTFTNYTWAKGRLFETQSEESYAVLNADDPACVSYAALTRAQPFWFSNSRAVSPGIWGHTGTLISDGVPLIRMDEIPMRGSHNVENTMAAAAAATLAGASLQAIASGIRSFPGVEHRLEFVRELNGVQYFNDSKATNVDATGKAIDAFTGGLWIILGGKDKDSNYTPLREKLETKARGVLLIGGAAEKIASQLNGLPLIRVGTLNKAVEHAAREAAEGETVLLAPACASFDQFENFEHRGRIFKDAVRAL